MKSIVIYIDSMKVGGAERVVLELVRALVARGLRPILVLNRSGGELSTELPLNVEVVILSANNFFSAVLKFTRFLLLRRPDLVLSHLTMQNLTALLAREFVRFPMRVFIVQHQMLSYSSRLNWKERLVGRACRALYRKASLCIGVSDAIVGDLIRNFAVPVERCLRIYNPVITPGLRMKLAQSSNQTVHDRPFFVAIGRLDPVKRFDLLLRAFAVYAHTGPNDLVILGDGLERSKLKELAASLDIGSRLRMCGHCDDVLPFLVQAQALVITSEQEGFGIAAVESMAAGCPIIMVRGEGGLSEIVDNGRLARVVPADVGELASELRRFQPADFDRAELQRRSEDFTLEIALNAYLEAFRRSEMQEVHH